MRSAEQETPFTCVMLRSSGEQKDICTPGRREMKRQHSVANDIHGDSV